MGERRNAASLFSHSLKTPLSSVKVATQLLLRHLSGQLGEKDQQLLEMVLRNASTLETRINKLIELSHITPDRFVTELSLDQLELIHSLAAPAAPEAAPAPQQEASHPPSGSAMDAETPMDAEPGSSKIIIRADPEIADLIPKFLENRLKDIDAIREALERNDFESIRMLGHSMKGAGGGYGFSEITEIGRLLEDSAKIENAEDIRKSVEALELYMNTVEVIYDEF